MAPCPDASDDEIELSVDPYDDLPEGVAEELERFVFVTDSELAMQRVEAVEFILEQWDDLEEDDEVGTWPDRHGGRPLVVATDDEGNLVVFETLEPGSDPAEIIEVSEDFIGMLADKVVRQPERVRIAATEAIRSLASEWMALFFDDEKMLGHLLLHHPGAGVVVGQDHDEMIAVHARLHVDA